MVFAYVSIKGWIIDPYIQGLFDGSHEVLVLSPICPNKIQGHTNTHTPYCVGK